ncbi:hypothetical protein STVIR_1154 [Streptomyces viridochromogenes Tue57]|uniref:Uncharacterized protein n=1 Tax=Streptomyces viridochromogenes Tue57 TaxID=1160705 RepID=L8PK42_STRVR|nr:hypothetical protein STVIR_1154 [Streptomyces viridochromogenes Tue57]
MCHVPVPDWDGHAVGRPRAGCITSPVIAPSVRPRDRGGTGFRGGALRSGTRIPASQPDLDGG